MAEAEEDGGLSVDTLRRQYLDYTSAKREEMAEQREARHYYHGDQWTREEVAALKKRRQPVVTYNRVARKINGIVGVLERLRQDPKAYPRTPQHAEGADLGTATLRYATETAEWETKSPEAVLTCGIDGIGGVELDLVQGDHGDPDVGLNVVDVDSYFYDPRSRRPGFDDNCFEGVGKWVDEELAKEMFPDKADLIDGLMSSGTEWESIAQQDRETKWISSTLKRLRMIDHWYKRRGDWWWCVYIAGTKLDSGKSPFINEKGKTFSKYLMFSAAVDHDGDRYGFVRNLKSPQDEKNHRRSKALHNLVSRRLLAPKGSLDDVEKTRREAVRPDGVIEYNTLGEHKPEFDDARNDQELRGNLEMLAEANAEIENFGPNPALLGQGIDSKSGRAIQLLQQAGLAELGPFMVAYRGWKLRVYRAIWNTIQRYWTSERWIRVTDDEGIAQFIQINGVEIGPDGEPSMVNAIGSLDVDIILDEGPDTINMQADAYEALQAMLPLAGGDPAYAKVLLTAFIELSPLAESVKKQLRDQLKAMSQPDPAAEQAKQITLAGEAAKVENTKADTMKKLADAGAASRPDMPEMPQPAEPDLPSRSITYKDLPPEGQAQMLAQAGIMVDPAVLAAHEQRKMAEQAALKAASRPRPQNGSQATA